MTSRWDDAAAAACETELELRAYTSRLLGQDPSLVLHGGGNTSVKLTETNIFGEAEDILWVKGSGWDLAAIEPAGFAPVRMRHLLALSRLKALSDTDMARELRVGTIDPAAPSPSVEAILHAIVPFKYVDHTHADAVLTLTNSVNGAELIEQVYGDRLLHIPYVMPGFKLAALCADLYPETAWSADDRHGADEPRHLHLGRDRARVVRANDRHGCAGRGTHPDEGPSRPIRLIARRARTHPRMSPLFDATSRTWPELR